MSISTGSKILASDLSKVLTSDNFFDMIDLTALKEELGVANTSAAKIVGGGMGTLTSGSSMTITLSTSDWDYLEVVSYPVGRAQVYYSYNTQFNGTAASFFDPIITYIFKGQTSGKMPVKACVDNYNTYSNIYAAGQSVNWSLSGTTLTLSGFSYSDGTSSSSTSTGCGINVIAYKNS